MISSNKEKLRIGICGIGSIGFRHARLLSQRNDAALYLCDPVGAHLEAAASLSNLVKTTGSFDELLDSELDGLIIATPDHLHIPQAAAACQKGITVLIEKPIAENTAQAAALKERLRKEDGQVLVGYPLRYNAVFLKGKELLNEGLIGAPVSFHIMLGAYDTLIAAKNRFNITDENKLFIDYSHEWDYLSWFLGKVRRVAAISRQMGNLERTQNPNIVNCLLEMENGVTGTAHLDYVQSPGERRFTLIGDRGTLVVDAVRGQLAVRIYQESFERVFRVVESFDAMIGRQHDHFIEIVRSGNQPRVTIEDGINALCVADALIAASKTDKWQPVLDITVQ